MGVNAVIEFNTSKELTNRDLIDLSYRLQAAVGPEKFYNQKKDRPSSITRNLNDHENGIIYTAGYTVHVWSRYYGPGYERGDLWTLISIFEWLKKNLPHVEIFYSGDQGRGLDPWTDETRDEMIAHWAGPHGQDYFVRDVDWDEMKAPETGCKCRVTPSRYGFGYNYGAWSCLGCGKQWETRDGGASYQVVDESRMF